MRKPAVAGMADAGSCAARSWGVGGPDCRGRDGSRSRNGRRLAVRAAVHRALGCSPRVWVATDRRIVKCRNQAVMEQWPELALSGTIPDAATSKPPAASTVRSADRNSAAAARPGHAVPQRLERQPQTPERELEPHRARVLAAASVARSTAFLSSRIIPPSLARTSGPAATRPSARAHRRDRRRHQRGA